MRKFAAGLAIAVISSMGSTALAAEGDAPTVKGNIEIYGQAKVSYDMIDTGAKSPADETVHKISTNSSRLGFKGTEDLGDGMSAVFQVELGINVDGTTTSVVTSIPTTTANPTKSEIDKITYRNTFVGLRHQAAGTLLMGIYDTPYKTSTGRLDLFADTMGDYNAVIGTVNGTANFELRTKDSIVYLSPSWGGVNLALGRSVTGSETNTTNAGNASLSSASVSYDVKPLYITAAYEVHKNAFTTWDTNAYQNTGIRIGAGAVFGNTKVGAVYEQLKDDKPNSDKTRNAVYVSASQTFGKETIKIAYASADDGENPTTKTGAAMMAVGLDHSFSKRTTVFVLYAKTKNEENATYGFGQGGPGGSFTPNAGEDPSVVSFGLNHIF
jgi:predicted porin